MQLENKTRRILDRGLNSIIMQEGGIARLDIEVSLLLMTPYVGCILMSCTAQPVLHEALKNGSACPGTRTSL